MPDLTDELRTEYEVMYNNCRPRIERDTEARQAVAGLAKYKLRYFVIETALQIPWHWIAVIHYMESGGDFRTHLHNGDSLLSRTIHAPAGRPKTGEPPFSWQDSVFDALTMRGLADTPPWDIPRMLYEAERWNGFGYRNRGVPSPYLWGGSQHYVKGKYRRDHTWDSEAVSKQIGAALLLKALFKIEPLIPPLPTKMIT